MSSQLVHGQSLLALLAWADICTRTASGTIQSRHGDGKLIISHAGHGQHLHVSRSLGSFVSSHYHWTDYCMRTYIGTEITLDTVVRIPNRHIYCNTALLVSSRTRRCGTIHILGKCRYRKGIALLSADLGLYVVDKVHNIFSSLSHYLVIQTLVGAALPALRNLYLHNALSTCINSSPVLLNYILTLTAISLLSSVLHQLNRFLLRDNAGQLEECRLKNGVNTSGSHAGLNTNLHTINGIEVDVVVSDEFLHLSWQVLVQLFCIPRAV